jgi:hypothetical protein
LLLHVCCCLYAVACVLLRSILTTTGPDTDRPLAAGGHQGPQPHKGATGRRCWCADACLLLHVCCCMYAVACVLLRSMLTDDDWARHRPALGRGGATRAPSPTRGRLDGAGVRLHACCVLRAAACVLLRSVLTTTGPRHRRALGRRATRAKPTSGDTDVYSSGGIPRLGQPLGQSM